MMRMRTKNATPTMIESAVNGGKNVVDWELRPGGVLVQKRNSGSDQGSSRARTIKVRVKYGSSQYEIHVSSHATFGELKKLLVAQTGMHPQDQKILFRDKARDSNAYLDTAGVRDKSKIVLLEDSTSQEKRYLETRRNTKMERASKSITEISLEVDKLASQVSALEAVISRGGKVAENDVLGLIELLMTHLIKLDGIMADGDTKLQRRMQARRVQKYVETLDLLKICNLMPNGQMPRHPVVVMTKWETFDSASSPPTSSPKLSWEFFE